MSPPAIPPSQRLKDNPEGLGLRERNRRDKLRRISAAARARFTSGGYDGATLRDIAKEADVALGTLAIYAKNKSDLVLLIFNDAVARLIEKGQAAGVYEGSLTDAFVAFFRPTYIA